MCRRSALNIASICSGNYGKNKVRSTLDCFHTRLRKAAEPCSFADIDAEIKSQLIQWLFVYQVEGKGTD